MINAARRALLVVFVMLVLIPSAGAQENHFYKYVLDNGLTVLVNEIPSSALVAVDVWVKTGSANEGKYIGSGITHFVEHMLFKGTTRRGVGVISDEARAMGGSINASTSHDFTAFTLSLPKDRLDKGLDLIADMIRNPVFDPAETERERAVIQKEMKMVNDRPERKLGDALYQAVYLVHPYRYPIIGYPLIFKAITRDQLAEYYKTYYAPNNMILSVAGGVTADEALAGAKKYFDDFSAQSTPLRMLPQENQQSTPRSAILYYPTDLIRLDIAYQGMPLSDRDLFAADVLAMALGNGQSSRFNQELHEKQRLVESISAGNDTPMDRGRFEIFCLLSRDNVEDVLIRTQAIIDDVKSHGLKPEELDKVKRSVLAENIYSRETAEGVSYRAAMEEAFTGDAQFSGKYLQGVRAVTSDDVKRVAAKYLLPSGRTVVVMKPLEKKEPGDTAVEKELILEPQLFTLSNGIRVIVKKDPSLPLVSVRASIRGGLREEPLDKAGLAELTGRVWSRGVKGKTAEQLFREIEGRAGSLSAGAGLDSFSLSIDVLSEDLPLAFDDLALVLQSPVFPQDEFIRQKKDMLTALRSRKDSIAQTSFRALYETLFIDHPLRRDPLGTPDSLERLTRDDLVAFYNRFLSPENIIIAVYGDINPEKVMQELSRRLGDMKPLEVQTTLTPEKPVMSTRLKELTMDKEQALVAYGFHGARIGTPEKYALEVAVNALSASLSGRMFKRIRDELGKAYALSGFCSPGQDLGVCAFYVLTTNENTAKVRSLLEEELTKAADKGFSDQEIADAKIDLKSDFARDHQTVSAQVNRDLASEFYGLGVKAYQLYNGRIDAVTGERARAAVKDFFAVSKAAVVVTTSSRDASLLKLFRP